MIVAQPSHFKLPRGFHVAASVLIVFHHLLVQVAAEEAPSAQSQVTLSVNADEWANLSQPAIHIAITLQNTAAVAKSPERSLLSVFSSLLWIFGIGLLLARLLSKSLQIFHTTANFRASVAPKSSLSDVAGYDKVKESIMDFVMLMKDPKAIKNARALGFSDLPRGALLLGPPGTGKTALIRAVANEVGWSFFDASATGFIGTIVGAGVKAVRDLFDKARQQQPAIIFIDEIDAIGMSRGNEKHHEEYKKTMTALLTELDGFSSGTHQIVVFAATNCDPKKLDPALIRAGRFDRHIEVPLPTRIDRAKILMEHLIRLELEPSLQQDLGASVAKQLAKKTFNLSGADLKVLVGKAATLALKDQAKQLSAGNLHQACKETRYLGKMKMVGPPKELSQKLYSQYQLETQENLDAIILDNLEYRQKRWRLYRLKELSAQREPLQSRLDTTFNNLLELLMWRGWEALVLNRRIKEIRRIEDSINREDLVRYEEESEQFPDSTNEIDIKKIV